MQCHNLLKIIVLKVWGFFNELQNASNFLGSNVLHVLQTEINVMCPSERINVGVLDFLSHGFLRLHFVGREHSWGLGMAFFFDCPTVFF